MKKITGHEARRLRVVLIVVPHIRYSVGGRSKLGGAAEEVAGCRTRNDINDKPLSSRRLSSGWLNLGWGDQTFCAWSSEVGMPREGLKKGGWTRKDDDKLSSLISPIVWFEG